MKKKQVIINEDKCNYNSAIVLGLNDALVELSGALVGLSFALMETQVIATVGLITGFAAAMSMAASEYLSAKEDNQKQPGKAATHTGLAYLIAVIALVAPYFIFQNIIHATAVMFALVILIIACYTGYVSKRQNISFKSKFFSMLTITLGVSVISFLFGSLVKNFI
ncbi:MAG: VIT1/CCC1 transporter family protein [Nanoarchaeota archaeon]